MHHEIERMRLKLQEGGYTCILCINEQEYCSYERGVKPLLDFLQAGYSFEGALAADKTVGAGAAHLYVLLGVRALWANIVSQAALQVLKEHQIEVFYGKVVPHIINRNGDGLCPIESAVMHARTSYEAHELIMKKLTEFAAK